jgi:hypothetical protein
MNLIRILRNLKPAIGMLWSDLKLHQKLAVIWATIVELTIVLLAIFVTPVPLIVELIVVLFTCTILSFFALLNLFLD